MNRNYYILILLALSGMFISSCEEVIELDVPEGEKRIVFEGLLTNEEKTHFIKISTTADYFDYTSTPRISGAQVMVVTNEPDTIHFIETVTGTGIYESDSIARPGVEYRMIAILPNGRTYESFVETLKRVPPIDSIYQSDDYIDSTEFFDGGYYIYTSAYEPPGVGDFYRWIIYVNGRRLLEPFALWLESDELVDGNRIEDFNRIYNLKPGDDVEIHQLSISERAYHFWYLLREQLSIFGSPFDSPPNPIEGNIRNPQNPDEEVFGFFGVSKVERKSYTVIDKR